MQKKKTERAKGRRDWCQHKRGRGSMNPSPPPPPIVPCTTVAVCQVWLRVRLRDVLQNLLHVLVVAIARCQQAKILPVRAQFNLWYVISYSNNKYFQRVSATAIRDFRNQSTRRLVEDGMSTWLTNTHTARGLFVPNHVFAWKQCIVVHYVIKVTLDYLVTSLRDSFCS